MSDTAETKTDSDGNAVLDEKAQAFVDKVFKCEPPCDSYGVCTNCCEKTVFHAGYNFGVRAQAASPVANPATCPYCKEVFGIQKCDELYYPDEDHLAMLEKIHRLEAENKRLREAIQAKAKNCGFGACECMQELATDTLKVRGDSNG